MKEQILRQMIRESVKKMISETNALNEYSGDSGLEELIEVLGYSDVMDFFEDNSGAVEAVISWAESIPQLRQKMKQAGMTESTLKEAEQTVKSEAASRLADFFRVPAHTLDKFNFDGNDNIKAVSNALKSTSMQGAQMYYDMAIKLAKEDLGVEESKVNEASMSDIDIMAQEAKDFKSFVTEFIKTHHDLSKAGEPGQFKDWLQSVYNNAKANMDESVVNEADMSRQYDGYIVLDQKTKKQYKFKYIRGVDNVKDENDAIKTIMYLTKQPRSNFMVHGLIKKGEFDKTKGEVVNEAKDFESFNNLESAIKHHEKGDGYYDSTRLKTIFNQLAASDQQKARTKYSEYFGKFKKGEFDKTTSEVVESTNAMRTKIKEAGGRRFAKTESIRQHNISKIKEANKKN